jgi:hypothetical protein
MDQRFKIPRSNRRISQYRFYDPTERTNQTTAASSIRVATRWTTVRLPCPAFETLRVVTRLWLSSSATSRRTAEGSRARVNQSRINISIPVASSEGLFHGRFPQGNAFSGAQLQGVANDPTFASGNITSETDSLTVIFPEDMQQLSVGTPVQFTISAIGGAGQYPIWSGAGLPPGVTVTPSGDDETGLFSGTPTEAGDLSPSITPKDSAGNFGTGAFQCVVN